MSLALAVLSPKSQWDDGSGKRESARRQSAKVCASPLAFVRTRRELDARSGGLNDLLARNHGNKCEKDSRTSRTMNL